MKYKVTEAHDLEGQVIGVSLNEAGPEERTRREQFADHVEYIDIFDDLETAQVYYEAVTTK